MSLINKMLQDLDARGTPAGQSFPSNVMPVAHQRRTASLRLVGGAALAGVACVALAWFAWTHWHAPRPARGPVASAVPAASRPAPLPVKPIQGMGGTIAPAPANAPAPKIAPPGAVEPQASAPVAAPLRQDAAAAAASAPVAAPGREDTAVPAAPPMPSRAAGPASAPAVAPPRRAGNGHPERGSEVAVRRAGDDDGGARAHVRAHAAAPSAVKPRSVLPKSVLPMEPDSEQAREARRAAAIELATRGARLARLARLSARQARAAVAKAASKASPRGRVHAEGIQEAPAQHAEDDYRRALASLQDGRTLEAIAALQQALRIDPGHDAARQTLVGLLVESGRTDEAMHELQLGLARDPRQPALAMLLARLQIEHGGSGIDTLERSLPYAGNDPEYHGFLAGALEREQRHREAALQYQQALRAAPGNGVWWMGLGIALQADKRNPEALDAFRKARGSGSLNADLQAFVEGRIGQLGH